MYPSTPEEIVFRTLFHPYFTPSYRCKYMQNKEKDYKMDQTIAELRQKLQHISHKQQQII